MIIIIIIRVIMIVLQWTNQSLFSNPDACPLIAIANGTSGWALAGGVGREDQELVGGAVSQQLVHECCDAESVMLDRASISEATPLQLYT